VSVTVVTPPAGFVHLRRPTAESAFVVVSQGRAGGRATRAGMTRATGRVAAGHVAHGVIGGIWFRDAGEAGDGVQVIGVAIGIIARLPTG
jgi:hypothetical protein